MTESRSRVRFFACFRLENSRARIEQQTRRKKNFVERVLHYSSYNSFEIVILYVLIWDIGVISNRSPTWRRTTNVEIGHVGWSGIASELERSEIRGWTQW